MGTPAESVSTSGTTYTGTPLRDAWSGNDRSSVAAPNKRLKLAGADRLEGSGVLCAGAHELSFNDAAPGGRVARSLSAIR